MNWWPPVRMWWTVRSVTALEPSVNKKGLVSKLCRSITEWPTRINNIAISMTQRGKHENACAARHGEIDYEVWCREIIICKVSLKIDSINKGWKTTRVVFLFFLFFFFNKVPTRVETKTGAVGRIVRIHSRKSFQSVVRFNVLSGITKNIYIPLSF